jgi:hypothetical protein
MSDSRGVGRQIGDVTLSLAVTGGDQSRWQGDRLTGAEAHGPPRAPLATGFAALALPAERTAVLGFGQSADTLLAAAAGTDAAPAMLVAGRAGDFGIGARPGAGAALAQRFGAWTASVAVGQAQLAAGPALASAAATQAVVRLDRALGAATVTLSGELLAERGALLGSRLAPAFGVRGATTTLAGLAAQLPLGAWTLAGDARAGIADPDLSGAGIIRRSHGLVATSASLSLARDALLTPGDRFSLAVAQPLRLAGAADLALGGDPVRTGFGAGGREIAAEARYGRALGGGWIDAGLFWRHEPGHIAGAPPDAGAMLRYRIGL